MRNDESGWVRAYQVILRLLPQRVHVEAKAEMVELFRCILAKTPSQMGRLVLLGRGLVDAVATAVWGLTVKRTSKKQGAFQRDLLGATRALRHSPGMAIVVVVTLAVGIGSVTTTFSVVNGVLLTPIQLSQSENLVTIWGRSSTSPQRPLSVSDLHTLRAESTVFEAVVARWTARETVDDGDSPQQVHVAYVTADYLPLLGVTPSLGRGFREGEEVAGSIPHEHGFDASLIA